MDAMPFFYVAGHPAIVEFTRTSLVELGVPEEFIRIEEFIGETLLL